MLSRRTTNTLRGFLDDWLPPVIRELPPFKAAVKWWLGPAAMPEFKYRAFRMTEEEFAASNRAVAGLHARRPSDTTQAQAKWVLEHIGRDRGVVLEIGPGHGELTRHLRGRGFNVVTLGLFEKSGEVEGSVERIPLPDKCVDVVILCHVIEHARSLTRAFCELARVSRHRVLIVTPKQRFYRWTFDYHLHFFYSVDHLASFVPRGLAHGTELDGDLCLLWQLGAPVESDQLSSEESYARG